MHCNMPATTFKAVAERIEVLAYNVRSFRLRLAEPAQMPFDPGQFLIVHVPKDGGTVKRAYSIASPPHEAGIVELCIQHVEGGAASTFFWKLKQGDPVTLSGPHGNFKLKQPIDYEPVFMATGTGVAPFRSMAKHLYHQNIDVPMWMLFGTRYEHTVLYESEFRALASVRPNFHYLPTCSRPKDWKGLTGHVQQTFQSHITDYTNKEIYICGWMEIVKAIVRDLESFGVPRGKIHFEEWA
jgi:NAD(P)H-flavin reductase